MTRHLALAAIALLALLAPPSHAAAPAAVFPETSFDFGDVPEGSDVEHEFVLKNTGDAPLHIVEARPSCGCTVVDFTKEIPPGGQGVIKAHIKLKELPAGRASKTINVMTDAPGSERVVLQVKLNYVPLIEFNIPGKDRVLRMSSVRGEVREDKILARPHVEGMKITAAKSSNPAIEVLVEPAKSVGKQGEGLASMLMPRDGDAWLTIRVKSTAPLGPVSSQVSVVTNKQEFKDAFKIQVVVKEPEAKSNPS